MSVRCEPHSVIIPPQNSHEPRRPVFHTSSYGSFGAGPSHMSQSMPGGGPPVIAAGGFSARGE